MTDDTDPNDEAARVEAIAIEVAAILQKKFGHSAADSRALFEAFHAEYSRTGKWAPADYYDHETAKGIALEVEFRHRFPAMDPRGMAFLDWRQNRFN